jgi:hypothetical protein
MAGREIQPGRYPLAALNPSDPAGGIYDLA